MSLTVATIGMTEIKANFSKLTADANAIDMTITVFKNNKPRVEIRPLATTRDDFKNMSTGTLDAIQETEGILVDPTHVTYKDANDVFAALGL